MFLDEAYSSIGGDQHLTPFSSHQLKKARRTSHALYEKMLCFNNFLSSHRITIERAFGIFCAKWGILWRPLEHSIGINTLILRVCAKLHNKSIEHWKVHGARADQILERERIYAQQHDSRVFQSTGVDESAQNPNLEDDPNPNPNPNNRLPPGKQARTAFSSRKKTIMADLFDNGILYSAKGTNGRRIDGEENDFSDEEF